MGADIKSGIGTCSDRWHTSWTEGSAAGNYAGISGGCRKIFFHGVFRWRDLAIDLSLVCEAGGKRGSINIELLTQRVKIKVGSDK